MYEQVVNNFRSPLSIMRPHATKTKQIWKLHRNLCHIYHTPRWTAAQQKRLDSWVEPSGT